MTARISLSQQERAVIDRAYRSGVSMRRLLLLLISPVLLAAQAPTDTTFYTVSYVDIAPASKPAAITAYKQYRDASRKDDGFVRYEFFEQVGRPGHFCLIETWANQKAF